jgi:hypothetical protein
VRIHEYVKVIFLCELKNNDDIVNPLLVILARSGMLNGFPGEDESYGVVSPMA